MRKLPIILTVLGLVLALQAVGLLMLALLIYQATPNRTLATETYIGRIPGMLTAVRTIDRSMNVLYRGPNPPEALPYYELDIDPAGYQKLQEALPTEMHSPWYQNLVLQDENKVWAPAKFRVDGEEYDVEVRVRGDVFNHWYYRKKSWRVKFKKNQLFNGMKQMNLIIPEDREWYAEHMNAYRAKQLGLLYPPVSFASVSINGSRPLLYTQIEHWGKEMIEKLGRSGDTNIYQTGGGNSYFQQWDPSFQEIGYWDKYIEKPLQDTYDEVDALLKLTQENAHKDPEYLTKLSQIIDIDQLASWYAVGLLAGSKHIDDFNIRLYFDPARGVFEPLPWDLSLYVPRSFLYKPGGTLLNEAMRSPLLKLSAHRLVWRYVTSDDVLERDREQSQYFRALIERAIYRDKQKLPSNRTVAKQLDTVDTNLAWNLRHAKEELERCEILINERIPSTEAPNLLRILDITARGIAFGSLHEIAVPAEYSDAIENGALQLWRDDGDGTFTSKDTRVPLALRDTADKNGRAVAVTQSQELALLWAEDAPTKGAGVVAGAPHTRHRFYVVLPVEDPSAVPIKLDIRNAVTDKKADIIGEVVVDDRTFERLPEASASREEFLTRYPFFGREGSDGVVLRDAHTISETVIIPSTVRLIVKPGTLLRMQAGASILSYAPVTMIGYKDQPIRVQAQVPGQTWGVFAVLNANAPSALQWVEFADGGEAYLNGTFFSGMAAFHASPVTITDSVFRNAYGDDGLNLKYVFVDLNRVRFERNSADGLDVDMAPSGTVENSIFYQNGNDGLDISWSPIVIRNIESIDNGDKCISVGERSTPHIHDATVKGCIMGIAVKDDSHAQIERVSFEDNDIAISSYVKKPFFGPPSATVTESTFTDNGVQQETYSGAVITIK